MSSKNQNTTNKKSITFDMNTSMTMNFDDFKNYLNKFTIEQLKNIAKDLGYKGNVAIFSNAPKSLIIDLLCPLKPDAVAIATSKDIRETTGSTNNDKWHNRLKNLSSYAKNLWIENDKKEMILNDYDIAFDCVRMSSNGQSIIKPIGIIMHAKKFAYICNNYKYETSDHFRYRGVYPVDRSIENGKMKYHTSETDNDNTFQSSTSTGFKHKSDSNPCAQWGEHFATEGFFVKCFILDNAKYEEELRDSRVITQSKISTPPLKFFKDRKDVDYDVFMALYPIASKHCPKIQRSNYPLPIDNYFLGKNHTNDKHVRKDVVAKSDAFASDITMAFHLSR